MMQYKNMLDVPQIEISALRAYGKPLWYESYYAGQLRPGDLDLHVASREALAF